MVKNLTITCLLGLLAIILGAFGTHSLRDTLTFQEIQSFQTAVYYQFFHVLVLLFLNSTPQFSVKEKNRLSFLFFTGILFFSGSIYCSYLTSISMKNIWFITPLGGVFFILGWFFMGYYFFKKTRK